jgi:hypothetical protein
MAGQSKVIDVPVAELTALQPGWQLTMLGGEGVFVVALHQELVYENFLLASLMAGPEYYISQSVERAKGLFPKFKGEPFILEPVRYKGVTEGGYKWQTIPQIRCIAELQSKKPVHDSRIAFSSSIIVWFQAQFGFPDSKTVAQIESLHWAHIAIDWE